MNPQGKLTRSRLVHDQLRSEIIRGEFAPGTPLRLADLSTQYGVSMAVVREALIRLSGQHLVVLAPNQGFRVVELSREDLAELTDLRVMLESRALQDSIEKGDAHWEAGVIAAHHVLERAQFLNEDGLGTTDEWSEAHSRFHDALGAACGSLRLVNLIGVMRDSSELYRQLSSMQDSEAARDVTGEHRELMTLATDRNASEATAALERHLRRTTDYLLRSKLLESRE